MTVLALLFLNPKNLTLWTENQCKMAKKIILNLVVEIKAYLANIYKIEIRKILTLMFLGLFSLLTCNLFL